MTRHPLVTVLACLWTLVPAFSQEIAPTPADSLASDSLEARMMAGMGTVFSHHPGTTVTDSVWYWSDARTLPQVFGSFPGVYRYELGELGKEEPSTFIGADQSSEGITVDGVPLGSPVFGGLGFGLFPLESLGSIELLSGPAALLAGSRWNLVTRQFASARPRTAIRFVQEPFESILSDGFYSQNIARSTNLLFGFQRRTSDGRFRNARLDSWHLRGRMRYNATPRINLMGNWSYEKTTNGLNGGVDRLVSPSLFDDVRAAVVEPQAYDLLTATDLSLHVLADVLDDSLSLTRLSIHQRNEEREFNRPVPTLYDAAARAFAISSRTDLKVEQTIAFPFAALHGMGQMGKTQTDASAVLRQLSRTVTAFGASLEGRFTPLLVPSVAIRVDHTPEGSSTSFAGKADIHLWDMFTMSGSMERRSILPSAQMLAWKDSLLVYPATVSRGTDQVISLGLRWDVAETSFLEIEGFQREQTDRMFLFRDSSSFGTPILSGRAVSMDWSGVRLSGKLGIGPFSASGWITTVEPDGPDSLAQLLPKVWARWEISWMDRLFKDELGLRLVVRGTFYDRHNGVSVDPRTLTQAVQSFYRVGRATRLDAGLTLDIGDTFVTIAWENLLNAEYFKVPSYPMSERRFSLGVRWEFND